jgi:hypothetical protein
MGMMSGVFIIIIFGIFCQLNMFKLMKSTYLKRVPLSIATWRSRMVCLSLSAGIPGLELPDMFVRGLLLSTNIQPFGLFSSLCKSRSMFSSSIN